MVRNPKDLEEAIRYAMPEGFRVDAWCGFDLDGYFPGTVRFYRMESIDIQYLEMATETVFEIAALKKRIEELEADLRYEKMFGERA